MVNKLDLNHLCKGGIMKRLLKPRFSKECGVLYFNHSFQ